MTLPSPSSPNRPRPAPGTVVGLALALTMGTVAAAPAPAPTGQELASPRPLELADFYESVSFDDLQRAPDGSLVYRRTAPDRAADGWRTSIWIHDVASGDRRQLTDGAGEGAGHPRISPDGRFLAFIARRERGAQVWLLPMTGGESWRLTDLPEGVGDFEWAPDGSAVVVVSQDPRAPTAEEAPASAPEGSTPVSPAASDASEDRPVPWVISRLQFKEDGTGYIGKRRQHLYRVDVSAAAPERPAEAVRLTDGPWDDSAPAFSPDGRWIAFSSNRTETPDANNNTELWLVPAGGGEVVQVTDDPGADAGPVWSPDGRWLGWVHVPADPPVYANSRLRIVGLYGPDREDPPEEEEAEPPLAITDPIELTTAIDRPLAGAPTWAPDMTEIFVAIQDRGTVPLVRVGTGLTPVGVERPGGLRGLFRRRPRADPEDRGAVRALVAGPRVVEDHVIDHEAGAVFAVIGQGAVPHEIYRLPLDPETAAPSPMNASTSHVQPMVYPTPSALTPITRGNSWRDAVALAEPEPIRFATDDDVFVEGWVMRPPGSMEGQLLPLLVLIHGGPVAQHSWEFSFERQWLVAQGYAVMFINPRGSSGYGQQFAHALWAQWGVPDLADILAGVDHLIDRGIADPERLGVGGWSYGGILTNYVIAESDRFAAAISGASETNYLACYGTDDLQRWWEDELGLPYEPEAQELYRELSPIYRTAAIDTPTLFLVGEQDWRVPLSQSEQMYTHLRRRMLDGGPDTALIVYPGESHGLRRPSFILDRWMRYKAWYDRYVRDDPEADPLFGELAW